MPVIPAEARELAAVAGRFLAALGMTVVNEARSLRSE
jgi:hypothetical protein